MPKPQDSAAPAVVNPEAAEMSKDLTQKVHDAVQKHIDAGGVPGVITLISRGGQIVYWDAQGVNDAKTKMPLQKDTVFWVASMTKPVVATAVMMMVEAGKIHLEDPVYKYIPEFKAPAQVRVPKPGSPEPPPTLGPPDPNAPKPEYNLVPANRPITVKDLMTHTSGIQTITIPKPGLLTYAEGDTLANSIPKLATVPLDFQPGSKWAYSNAAGFDVLARIVEITSGRPFNEFVKSRIFDPLGMKSSSFGPREDLASRNQSMDPNLLKNGCINGKTFFCGSAGLWMPADDYWRFAEMLLNEGAAPHGKRLLKASSVQGMSTNHVGSLFPGFTGIPATGMGFGYSMEVVTDQAASGLSLPTGSFGWNGVGTRQFWVIPADHMVIVMYVPSGEAPLVHRDIESAATSSVVKQAVR